MPKTFIQDIVPTSRRSIRNIPLPGAPADIGPAREPVRSEKLRKVAPPPPEANFNIPPAEKPRRKSEPKRGFPSFWLWILVLAIVLGGVYAGSFLFVSATVKISPKEMNVPINITGVAKIDPAEGELGYEIVTLTREGQREVPASGETQVQKSATGKIVVYNNYSTEAQTLVAKTRFETSNGLIFRIQDQVTVPGQKTANGTKVPGSVTVTVVADKPGDSYNVGLADFTIPGFKGDPRFEKFSAKSDPSAPIAGGFVGVVKKVSDSDLAASKIAIEAELKKELTNMLTSQIPDTHVMFKGGATFNFDELPQGDSASNATAILKEKGSIYGILFEKDELNKFLANKVEAVKGKDIHVGNLESIAFSLDDINSFDPETTKQVSFKLSGNTNFVWNTNTEEIKRSLIGQKRRNIKAVLSKFESVDRASVSLNPVWILSIPKDPNKIEVKIEPVE